MTKDWDNPRPPGRAYGETGTNLDFANTLRVGRYPQKPRDEYFAETWDMIYSKLERETWRERFAYRILERLVDVVLRHPRFRRRLCLALAAEMRDVDAWLDQPKPAPPPPHND